MVYIAYTVQCTVIPIFLFILLPRNNLPMLHFFAKLDKKNEGGSIDFSSLQKVQILKSVLLTVVLKTMEKKTTFKVML